MMVKFPARIMTRIFMCFVPFPQDIVIQRMDPTTYRNINACNSQASYNLTLASNKWQERRWLHMSSKFSSITFPEFQQLQVMSINVAVSFSVNKREDCWVPEEETARLSWVESRSDHFLDLFTVVPSSKKSSAVLANNQLIASCQLGFLTRYVKFKLCVSDHLSLVPVN